MQIKHEKTTCIDKRKKKRPRIFCYFGIHSYQDEWVGLRYEYQKHCYTCGKIVRE